MYIDRIKLHHFRNYQTADLTLGKGLNVLVGQNAQGKTNILEAVFLCCTGRSHRTSRDRELIGFGQERAKVEITCQRQDGAHFVHITLSQMARKMVLINNSPIAKLGEMMGHVSSVLFSPEDLRLVKDGPAERRRFLDMELSQMSTAYFYDLQRYHRALSQRNHLLREMVSNPSLEATLDVWDEQLAASGMKIIVRRAKFLQELDGIARERYHHIADNDETLSVTYQTQAMVESEAAFLDRLQKAQPQDRQRLTTTVGPHRDDIILSIDGHDVRAFGSQGQQRTAALAMKLSELTLMQKELNEAPILMLDDVMSELDPDRKRMLLSSIGDTQTIMTCTDLNDLAGVTPERVFEVKEGILS